MPDEQFYDEGAEDEKARGQIKDVGKAQEIAKLEKPARDRELELKKQTETGLTQEQRDNLQIMKGLKEKYPDAFESVIDDKGREVMILIECPGVRIMKAPELVLSQNGIVNLDLERGLNRRNIDPTKLVDWIGDKFKSLRDGKTESISYGQLRVKQARFVDDFSGNSMVKMYMTALEDQGVKEHLREIFQKTQKIRQEAKAKETEGEKGKKPERILADLI